jgi:hypothetical protein
MYDLAFRHEWFSTFRLLAPLPLTARFPSCSVPLWVEVGERHPRVTIHLDHTGGFVAHHSTYSSLEDAEKYLRGPLDVPSPSRAETAMLQLVKQGQVELLAGRHTKLRYLRASREWPARQSEWREIEARYPADGWKRIERFTERPW